MWLGLILAPAARDQGAPKNLAVAILPPRCDSPIVVMHMTRGRVVLKRLCALIKQN